VLEAGRKEKDQVMSGHRLTLRGHGTTPLTRRPPGKPASGTAMALVQAPDQEPDVAAEPSDDLVTRARPRIAPEKLAASFFCVLQAMMRGSPSGDAWWLAVLAAQRSAREMGVADEDFAAAIALLDKAKSGADANSVWPKGFF
jgi:hypothetical protein